MKRNPKAFAVAGVVFVNIMWGLSFIASKYALNNGLKPFSLAMVRYLTAPLALLPVMFLKEGGLHFPKKDWPLLLLSGLFGISIYFYFESNGVLRTSAANASLILAAIPVFTMLANVLLHHKRPSVINWLGTLISLFGVYLVVSADQSGSSTLAGNLFMLAACVCWVIYGELTNRLLKSHSSLYITFWQSVFALISLLPLGLTEGVDWAQLPLTAWLAAAGFLGLICSALCFILYANSIAQLSPTGAAIFINLNPLSAVLGSLFLLNESILPLQLLGGVLIIGSIFLVNHKKQAQKTTASGIKKQ